MSTARASERAQAVMAGDVRAGSRLMRDLDDRRPGAVADLKAIFARTGRAYVVGVTGNPGVGKSTVVDALIESYRAAGHRVGVVAVDPTSPFSGGAILGDRIRMQRHALDRDVFIRSLATRGHLGGLSRSTFDVVCVLDALGFDRILVETVGVGQDEVDVMKSAATSVVITVPGLGDDIQALKAGILEIADVLVVNKADREGTDRAVRDLVQMLDLRQPGGNKEVEILQTIAARGTREGSGVSELVAAIERHREQTSAGEEGRRRALERARAHLLELVRALLADRAEAALRGEGKLERLAAEVAERRCDPYSAAETVVENL
jgi:LAO/AO transport system kinase